MKALEIKNLRKVYDTGTVAVDGVSLSVDKGEFFGFLGPNGAGKSTTIHCITGISTISEGEIFVNGLNVVSDYREARKQIGLSPQEFDFEFFGPIYDTLKYIAGYFGIRDKQANERIDELMELFDLEKHKDKKFNELSGGLKRRVILARSLLHDPDILILDEPTAGVDVELRHDLWNYFEKLNKAGKTIILTSHYLEEVEKLCSRIGIINQGKIAVIDSKKNLTRNGNSLEDTYLKVTKGESW